ncbi:M20 family metallo-hydrolase [Paenibacillus sp. OV219]|uniref:M20 family metallo-hydrolase n=1 Tax=Paenibacillus sp. OV219 TaxID=1884377 RepID=UPI0021095409|nr:M20 family metallo-hydrolase [Paenibacillus sp. OV219]
MEKLGTEAEGWLRELGQFGADAIRGGVTRLLYTEEWVNAQLWIAEEMKQEGLEVRTDEVGNVYGRLSGTTPELRAIVTGSHVDTVVCGGIYDGSYGIVAAIIALRELKQRYGQPRRTIEAVSLSEEEGSRFPLTCWGSGSITGKYLVEDAVHIRSESEGLTLSDAMRDAVGKLIAGAGISLEPALRHDVEAFIELHIEQGGVLEEEGVALGIVDRIVGQKRATITVLGESNHAGTTPMHMRRDALHASVAMIAALNELASEAGAPLTFTVGSLQVEPNLSNVIPGKVVFTIDMRHPSDEKLQVYYDRAAAITEREAGRFGVDARIELWMNEPSAGMNAGLRLLLEQSCIRSDASWKLMPSGAGHDAQLFAAHCKTAMLFVPSRGGISHSPFEYTPPAYLGTGIHGLIDLLYELAYTDVYEDEWG